MAHWKIDIKNSSDGGSCPLPQGVEFYGEKDGDTIDVDFSKPITLDGENYNVSNTLGVGTKFLSLTIKKQHAKMLLPTWAVCSIVATIVGLGVYSVYQIVKLNRLGY